MQYFKILMEKQANYFCILNFVFLLIGLIVCSCEKVASASTPSPDSEPPLGLLDSVEIQVTRTFTNKTLYAPSEGIELGSFTIKNNSGRNITIDSIILRIGVAHTNGVYVVSQNIEPSAYALETNDQVVIPERKIISPKHGLASNSYLVHADLVLKVPEDGRSFKQVQTAYLTFFRIAENADDLTYTIASSEHESLPVFTLHGGLSAEYTAQKAAASLAGGISHSWNIPKPGMGPAPIKSTPDFLQRSLQNTVDFYDNTFGSNQVFETVIISTGIPSGAYLARAVNAPVLPIHFLVGAHTMKEVQTMLDYSETQGTKAYATIGHDYSLSNNMAVAWIKLLTLPAQYQQFLIDHQVQNVIFHGALGLGGESAAKKLADENEHYGAGSIYIMHFAGSDSETYLKQTIRDFDRNKLGARINIADWEAGVIDPQVDEMSASIKEQTSVETVELVTTHDAIELWNMGTYMMLHLLKKNNLHLKGVSLNPYLIGHPVFETYEGYVPFLYWQGFDPQFHIDNRFNTVIQNAVKHYYPDTTFHELSCWINSTQNFGGTAQGINMSNTLKQNGYENIIDNNYVTGEEWLPSDGMESSVEVRTERLLQAGVEEVQQWNEGLRFLTIDDLRDIANTWPDILVISK